MISKSFSMERRGENGMLDEKKLVEFLESEIESCRIVGNVIDNAIKWELKRILERVKVGMFDAV